ncbi:hypothetical protein DXG03_000769 [Asterophora parasitica]|uniref:BRCT domain-containing protein n=1 Tax=Asterophora parasitica TaxID=117018 RepID=A0A9P7KF84_9AGAR|nr:hypothetical protein DXG03_000769 [Asterophora parasitica]
MSTFEGSSDLEGETQATQLLQSILDPGDTSWNAHTRDQPPEEDRDGVRDLGSSPSRHSGSITSYQFHGLGQTQTQLLDDGFELAEGSQKENIATNKSRRGEEGETATSLTAAPPSSTSLASPSGVPALGTTKPKTAGAKTVSFQSPRRKSSAPKATPNPARQKPTRSTTYPVAGSILPKRDAASPIASQDSFGVLEQEDAEQLFLATSKQFNVPLADLPRVVLPSANDSRQSPKKSMYSSRASSSRYRRSPSPAEGTVLVESTPSLSDGSQSQSQQFQQAQLVETQSSHQPDDADIGIPMGHGGDMSVDENDSDAPSSSYHRLHEERDEDDPPAPALDATQPLTQVEEDQEMESHSAAHPFDAPVESHTYPTTIESTTTTRSRNLLSMVDPRKRYRYEHHAEQSAASPPQVQHNLSTLASSSTNDELSATQEDIQLSFDHEAMQLPKQFPAGQHTVSTSSSHQDGTRGNMEQTQPSYAQTQPSYPQSSHQPPQRRFPVRQQAANHSLPSISGEPPRLRDQPADDPMDIVPDSEPLADEIMSDSRLIVRSPVKNQRRTGPQDHTALELVQDSTIAEKTPGKISAEEIGKALFPQEEEDEEDVPLAAAVPKRNKLSTTGRTAAKGKGRANVNDSLVNQVSTRKGKQGNTTASAAPRTTRAAASLPTKKASALVQSWENGEVPSSVPEQDLGKTEARGTPVAPKKGKGKATSGPPCKKPKRSTTVPAGRTRRRPELDYAESPLSASDDELLMQPGDDNDGTEPAEDEDEDPDFTGPDPGPSTRKRKRGGAAAKGAKVNFKGSKKAAKAPSLTPSTRQIKGLRSAASASRASDREPTRVFALWKSDGHFYPGTVHSLTGPSRFKINFDDETTSDATIEQIRLLLDLRIGDDVLVPQCPRGVKVVDVVKLDSAEKVSVRMGSGITEVDLQDIKIASKTISYAWKDRIVSVDTIVTTIKPEHAQLSSTPSKVSLHGGPSIRTVRGSLFDKTAFVVTIINPSDRSGLISAIQNNGGRLVNDWADVIRLEGTHSHSNNRWVLEKNDATWHGGPDIERAFLISDDSSSRPKFLIALALGIPCVSVDWIYSSIKAHQEAAWMAHLLPQGYSQALDGRASQQVDVDWGNSIHHLSDIMANKIPCKLFKGKTILCVGSQLVPKPMKGKKFTVAEEKTVEAHNAATRIILCMGAERVEAVNDLKYATAPVASFDFVIIKDPSHYGPDLEDGTTVDWPWVKECLNSSRLLPTPEWAPQNSESQDA